MCLFRLRCANPFEAKHKFIGYERFHKIFPRAKRQPQHDIAIMLAGRQHDNRYPAQVLIISQPTQHIKPVEAGHHGVEHNDIRPNRFRKVQRLVPRIGGEDLVASRLQLQLHELQEKRIVVSEENAIGHVRQSVRPGNELPVGYAR